MAPPNFTTTGIKIGLTLLIDFPDVPATISQAEIGNFLNLNGYSGYGNNGSVMNYFRENSKNLLTYSNVVTVYIRMTQPKSYYNDLTKLCYGQGRLLLSDALALLKASPTITP